LTASALAYNYKDILLGVILQPLGDGRLVYLTPGGGFNFIFQVALYAGLLAAAPMLIYQLYSFIRPALPAKAQRSSLIIVLTAFLLMLGGVAFGYFIAIPSALHFLSEFAGSAISPNLTADSYLSFFLAYIAGLGVLFELPLLLLFFHWIHPMTPGKLLKSERFVILFAFIAAAIITPTPDMLNQAMIAVPLILIYQLGVIAVLIAMRRDRRSRHRYKKEEVQREAPLLLPKSQTEKSLPPTPLTPTLSITTPPIPKRSLDGFSVRRSPSAPSRSRPRSMPPSRRLTPPERSVPPKLERRRSLSVDGFPIN
jgi:sec-independent protein translocase protein TatC